MKNILASCYQLTNLATHPTSYKIRLFELVEMLLACNQSENAFNYVAPLTVSTARRWLLSAAYPDTKLWEARETEPQNLGKNRSVA